MGNLTTRVKEEEETRFAPLHAAAEAGDLLHVQALVAAGADIEENGGSGNEGQTSLYRAAKKGHVAVVQYLVECGANKETRTLNDETPLFAAAEQGHVEVVRILVEHGANKHAFCKCGLTPLHEASFRGHVAVAEYLLEQGCDVNCVGCHKASTPLHLAASSGNLGVAQLLLRFGAKLDVWDNLGEIPMDRAINSGHHTIANAIRAEVGRRREHEKAVRAEQRAEKRAEETRHRREHEDAVRVKAKAQARMEVSAALHVAVRAGDLARVQALVATGADLEERLSQNGPTLLYSAAEKGHVAVARYLVERWANKEAANEHGMTPLQIAASYGHIEVVQMLVERGANKEAVHGVGWTSLIWASLYGRVAVAEYLLEQGCDINCASTTAQWTPLHWAAIRGHLKVAQLLLRYGAKLYVWDSHGRTPADVALENSHHAIVDAICIEETRRRDLKNVPMQTKPTVLVDTGVGEQLSRGLAQDRGKAPAPVPAAVAAGDVVRAKAFVAAGEDKENEAIRAEEVRRCREHDEAVRAEKARKQEEAAAVRAEEIRRRREHEDGIRDQEARRRREHDEAVLAEEAVRAEENRRRAREEAVRAEENRRRAREDAIRAEENNRRRKHDEAVHAEIAVRAAETRRRTREDAIRAEENRRGYRDVSAASTAAAVATDPSPLGLKQPESAAQQAKVNVYFDNAISSGNYIGEQALEAFPRVRRKPHKRSKSKHEVCLGGDISMDTYARQVLLYVHPGGRPELLSEPIDEWSLVVVFDVLPALGDAAIVGQDMRRYIGTEQ